jgi:uncharacterized protein YegL
MEKGKRIFAVCLVISVALHLVLLGIAPRIKMFNQAALRFDAARMFRLRPVEVEARPRPRIAPPSYEQPPMSLEEFLLRERERPELPPAPEYPRDELARELRDKVARAQLPREHATEPASAILEAIDIEVIAIHKRLLAENIDVSRRLIPEKERVIVPPDVMPTVSGSGAGRFEIAKRLPPAAPVVRSETPSVAGPTEVVRRGEERRLPPAERELVKVPEDVFPLREKPEMLQKYPSLDDVLEVSLATYEPEEEDGYFLIRITPKRGGEIEVMPKEVIFVIDASKSIREAKLEQSKAGLEACLAQLNEGDLFNIIAFKESPTVFRSTSVSPTSANIRAARTFVKGLKPSGETDVYSAIAPLVRITKPETHPYNIFLISDGKPTSGMVDSRAIINNLTRQNELRASIFTFAGGSEVNVYLLDLLAYQNKGRTYVADRVYSIDNDMPKFCRTIRTPILIDLRANYANLAESGIYPKVLPDFYMDSEILVSGRYGGTDVFSMRLAGTVNGQKKELVFRKEFAEADSGGQEIARMWAFNKIYKLIADMCQRGAEPELVEQVRSLSQRYGIATAYTPPSR